MNQTPLRVAQVSACLLLLFGLLGLPPGPVRAEGILFTETAELLPYGRLNLDLGGRYTVLEDGDTLTVLPDSRFTLGLGGVSELFVNLESAHRNFAGGRGSETGLRMFDIGTKFALDGRGTDEGPGGEALHSLYFRAKIPSADKNRGLGEDKTDLFGRFIRTGKLGKTRYDLNLGVGILQKAEEVSGQDDILIYSAALDHPVSDGTGLLLELGGRTHSTRAPSQSFVTAGVRFGDRAGENLQIGARHGLRGHLQDWTLLASYRLPLQVFGDAPDQDRTQPDGSEQGTGTGKPSLQQSLKQLGADPPGFLEVRRAVRELASGNEVESEDMTALLELALSSPEQFPCLDSGTAQGVSGSTSARLRQSGLVSAGTESCSLGLSATGKQILLNLMRKLERSSGG